MPVNNWNTPQQDPYRPAPMGPDLSKLESDSQLWLIVAVAGFFVGTMMFTGPLSWYQGNKLCESYRAIGAAPSQNANAARIIGMVTTIFSTLIIVGACVAVMGFVVFANSAQPR